MGLRIDLRRLAPVAGALVLATGLLACATTARNDRVWDSYLSHTTHVQTEADRFAVTPVTDWTYTPEGPATQGYRDGSFAFDDLRQIWFVLEPQPGSRLAAHTFLLFEFSDDRLLGVTIEARREANEDYSALRGAFNAYELAYVWGSARDLMTRRAVMLHHDVFMYPITITPQQRRDLLTRLLERTAALETHPRFYNTLSSNCTNELAKATQLKWHYSYILTGRSDEHLFRLGLIPGENFEQASRRAAISDFVRALNAPGAASDADFDHALLAELHRRGAEQ